MNHSQLQQIKQRYNIVGNSDALNHALDVALQVAPTDLSVLIVGESGVGKEIVPRLIHDNSPRKLKKYFAVNCGSIPEGTIDSELFGHEKGSFTGAIGESEGYFGIADKGTIFLDEVGELPLATQKRLLRVLETGEYIRVGGQEIRRTDVRVVAATNVNVRKAVSEGRFREDLYYRLNTIPIQMPPLRDRGNDILLLFRLFAMQMAEKYHFPRITLTEDAQKVMLRYKWPGNIRQLKNITEQMSILCQQRELDAETVKQYIPIDPESTQLATLPHNSSNNAYSYENEREMVFKILYDLRQNVKDLHAEMNSLRQQLDQNAPISSITPIPSIPSHSLPADQSSQAVDVEAEEIADTDTLNLDDISRSAIEKALERNHGNRRKAAQELGISERTIYRKLEQYDLER